MSVRSADEARAALIGGAAVIDIKEPDRGPLGRADRETWRAVRRVVPPHIPISIALGELHEWRLGTPDRPQFEGLSYRKLGLAGSGPDWFDAWARLRAAWGDDPAWVAVAYADWNEAGAPSPDEVLEAALATDCAGILLDTWDKSRPGTLDLSWTPWVHRARLGGLVIALAGGLDAAAIARLAPMAPNLFAVRGAACAGGDRQGTIDPARVALLVRAAGSAP